MWFDVKAALAEIQPAPPATPATLATPPPRVAEVAEVAGPRAEILAHWRASPKTHRLRLVETLTADEIETFAETAAMFAPLTRAEQEALARRKIAVLARSKG